MKNINKFIYTLGMVALLFTACSDFDEVNTDPTATTIDQSRVEYAINSSITGAQMNPDVAERAFVLNWKTAGRQHSLQE